MSSSSPSSSDVKSNNSSSSSSSSSVASSSHSSSAPVQSPSPIGEPITEAFLLKISVDKEDVDDVLQKLKAQRVTTSARLLHFTYDDLTKPPFSLPAFAVKMMQERALLASSAPAPTAVSLASTTGLPVLGRSLVWSNMFRVLIVNDHVQPHVSCESDLCFDTACDVEGYLSVYSARKLKLQPALDEHGDPLTILYLSTSGQKTMAVVFQSVLIVLSSPESPPRRTSCRFITDYQAWYQSETASASGTSLSSSSSSPSSSSSLLSASSASASPSPPLPASSSSSSDERSTKRLKQANEVHVSPIRHNELKHMFEQKALLGMPVLTSLGVIWDMGKSSIHLIEVVHHV